MALPVGDSYSVASGGVIAAGRFRLPIGFPTAPLTWGLVGSNTLADVDPALDSSINPNYPGTAPWIGSNGHPSVLTAWSGGAWDEASKCLYITGGGHADYGGNEAYKWSATTGLFTRLSKPTGGIGNTGALNDGLDSTTPCYFDGQPRAAHTYGNLQVVNGEFWNFQGANYSSGMGVCSAFKLSGSSWTRMSALNFGASYGTTVWDSTRSRFLRVTSGNARPMWWNPVDDSYGLMNHWTNNDEQEMYGVYDARRDIVLQFSKYITVLKCNDTSDAVQITATGPAPNWASYMAYPAPSRAGVVYDYANDRYLVWGTGSSIYILTPPAVGQDPLTATWTWSKLDPAAGNTVTPTAATSNGTYGRFWYSPSLNCCGVVNAVDQKMYVFRLA